MEALLPLRPFSGPRDHGENAKKRQLAHARAGFGQKPLRRGPFRGILSSRQAIEALPRDRLQRRNKDGRCLEMLVRFLFAFFLVRDLCRRGMRALYAPRHGGREEARGWGRGGFGRF